MINYYNALEADKYYHIYNHAVGQDNLFETNENYRFFLEKFVQYIIPIADIFAYCLLPNHFHFAVRIKSEEEIDKLMRSFPKYETLKKLDYTYYISKQFSNLFSSYTQAFNKQQNRKGNLFQKPFKRLHIDSDSYLRNNIHYIHHNPIHHKFTEDLRKWKHCSFNSFFSDKFTHLQRNEAIELFDDIDNFNAFHKKVIDDKMIDGLES